jgi:hypothetical protein
MKLVTRPLLLLSLFFLSQSVFSQVLEDYGSDWKEGEKKTWFSSNDRLILNLDLTSFPLSFLSFDLPGRSVIFVNEKLWFFASSDTVFTETLADFRIQFDQDSVRLTVFKSGILMGEAQLHKLLHPATAADSISNDQFSFREFDRQSMRDFFATAVVFILFMIAIYKIAYPYIFSMMVKPVSLLSAEDFSDSGSLQKFFSLDVLFYVFVVNMLLSLALITALFFFQHEWLSVRMELTFYSLMGLWFGGSIVLLALSVVKFAMLKIFSYLFDLGKVEFSHFFYLLRLIFVSTFGVCMVAGYFLFNNFSLADHALSVSFKGFFWIYIIGILGLFGIMVNRLGFKKYHLFTYLCIAELIPFLILAKWFTVLGY